MKFYAASADSSRLKNVKIQKYNTNDDRLIYIKTEQSNSYYISELYCDNWMK